MHDYLLKKSGEAMHPLSRSLVLLFALCAAQMAPASAQDDERLVRGRASTRRP